MEAGHRRSKGTENGSYDLFRLGYRDVGLACNTNYLELCSTYPLHTEYDPYNCRLWGSHVRFFQVPLPKLPK